MAILTRPLFHSQERIDLEDLVQLQSGLRTDARLWTRQVLADKNYILKGFDVSGIGTNQIAVNLLDATLLFSGRRDLTGVATIIVDDSSVAGDTITIANSDGSSFTVTAIDPGTPLTNQYVISSSTDTQASNIATAINNIGEGIAASSPAGSPDITVTASRTGFQTITASNPSNFSTKVTIIATFDYLSSSVESPADLSYFILQSGATGTETSISREISASERALVGVPSRTLFVYGRLVTQQGTPITKAFWDPSANSGAGAEFNQRVDTASDLAIELNVTLGELEQVTTEQATEFFANVAICEIEVDSSGIILSIRDTRPLFFEAQDDRPWDRANSYASMTLLSTIPNVAIDVMIPAGTIPGTTVTTRVQASTGGPFTLDETVSFWPISGSASEAFTSAQIVGPAGDGSTTTKDFNKLDLSAVPSRQRIAIGETSGTIRIVDEVRSNFFRDDKALGDFRNGLSALATEINNMKGTKNWYDDPPASAKDLLRFINTTIIGIDEDARYSWTAADVADGTLSIRREPLARNVTITVQQANGLSATQLITFTRTAGNIVLKAVSSSPGDNEFLVGVDAEATASHLSSAINAVENLSASFAQSGDDFIITVGSNDSTISTVASTATNVVVSGSPFVYTGVGNLANIKIYGVDADFFFPESTLSIGVNEVLFVTLPDLDTETVADQTYNQTQFRYSQSGPTSTAGAALWNSTNRNIFENSTDRFKTVPVNDFVSNERNYWVAYRDESSTIFVRNIGELGDNESADIGQGITNATLSYIGAPNENTSTPVYPTVTTINSFPPTGTEGAYLATTSAADFNKTLVAQSENLTSAINDLNNHLTSIKDTQYQNLSLKLIRGGFWNWDIPTGATNGNLTSTLEANIQVPGLADSTNKISALSTPGATTGVNSLADGDILFASLNRQSTSSPATALTLSKGNINTGYTPTRDRIVIARRVGTEIYIGINGTIKLANGQAAPIDSALQFLGIDAQSQLPRQLATAPSNVNGSSTTLDVSTSDIQLQVRGNASSTPADDGFVDLALPIGGQILFWDGATFNFQSGTITNEGTNNAFLGRTSPPSFTPATLTGTQEVYYAIAIAEGVPITDTTGTDVLPATDRDNNIGRVVGEPSVVVGTPGNKSGSGRAEPPAFEGAIPVALVRVTASGTTPVLDPISIDNVIILGSAGGGGGGGSGNAVQDINNYLNRLNGSTFGYFSALVPAVSTDDFVDKSGSTAGISRDGIALIAGDTLLTTNLIDPEFIEDRLIPERVEIEAIWGQTTEATITTAIDPNARWFISFNASDSAPSQFTTVTPVSTKNVVGVITSAGVLVGTNLTNAPLTQIDTFFVENHDFSTGHKVSLTTAGGLTLTDSTNIYVHSLDADSFVLYSTVANADLGGSTGRIEITATTLGSPVFTRGAGIIPRIGHTNTNRVIFDQRNVTLTGAAYSTTSNPTVRLFVTGDADAAVGSPAALMTSTALFYADQLGIEGVNPNGLDDLNDMIRGSHLVNPVNVNASYGAPGRGVTLLNNAATPVNTEIALDANNNITIAGTAPITTNGATDGQILKADANGIFSPVTRTITIPTPGETVFSARITNGGTAVVAEESTPFIASVNRDSLGTVTITWTTNFFSLKPNVTLTNQAGTPAIMSVNTPSTTGVTVQSFPRSSSKEDVNFFISVQRQGTDYTAARNMTTTITI